MPTALTERVPVTNQLLAALSRADLRHLSAGLEPVKLGFGEILHEQGESIEHVYFPNDSLVSLLTLVDRRHVLEVGMVGHEGMVGMALALGMEETSVRALVQAGGTAMRMKAAAFRREFSRCAPLQRGVHRYAHALMAQVGQTAACNRFHRVEARLARWLMMTRERMARTISA